MSNSISYKDSKVKDLFDISKKFMVINNIFKMEKDFNFILKG